MRRSLVIALVGLLVVVVLLMGAPILAHGPDMGGGDGEAMSMTMLQCLTCVLLMGTTALFVASAVRYLAAHRDRVDQALNTLAHVDGAVLARRASAPALFSVALHDRTCPPSTAFAAYHAWGGPAELEVYPFNDHEGGGPHHARRQVRWLRAALGDRLAL